MNYSWTDVESYTEFNCIQEGLLILTVALILACFLSRNLFKHASQLHKTLSVIWHSKLRDC